MPYLCQANLPTIAWGHQIDSLDDYPNGIDQATADKFLQEDLKIAANNVNRLVKTPLNQNQFDALCSLVFNVGIRAFSKSQMLIDLNNGYFIAAANEFDDWNHVNGEVSAGLTKRRMAEKALFMRLL